jgi:rubrerythrin
MKTWVCSVCGWKVEAEEPPEVCEVCGATKENFTEEK